MIVRKILNLDFGRIHIAIMVEPFIPTNGKYISNGLIKNKNKAIKLLRHSSNGYLDRNRLKICIMFC